MYYQHVFFVLAAIVLACACIAAGESFAMMAQDSSGGTPDQSTEPSSELTNTYCPVMTDEQVDPTKFTDYQGKRVYFCCARCKRAFDREPEKYVVNLAAFRTEVDQAGSEDHAAHSHGNGNHEQDVAHDNSHESENHGKDVAHDHATDHKENENVPRLLQWIGKFHPASVNFPIGLLVAAAVAEILFMLTGHLLFTHAARFCVWIGVLGALNSAILGWCFAGFHLVDTNWIETTHRWLGTSTATIAVILLFISERHHRHPKLIKRTRLYRAVLFLTAAIVSVTGFFGGAMLYGLDHYMW